MILSKVKWFVEKKESTNIMDCVVAIPASFDENARTEVSNCSVISYFQLVDAARIAGLNILGLVHDNTAGEFHIYIFKLL